MKITRFEVIPLKQRGLLLKVHTDTELVGYGSPMNYEHGRTVTRAVHDMEDYLRGRDPRQIEDHWQTLFRSSYSRQMPILLSALSGIEHACLDILGKSLDVPVWRLLGGSCRDRVRVYASVGGPSPDDYAKHARARVAEGYTALKCTPFPDPVRYVDTPAAMERIVARVAAIREAVGPEIDVAVDFHRAVSPAMARRLLKELEPLKPMFVEEPAHPENVDALLEITRSTTIPIATGERNTTRWGFRELVEKKAAAILQPDVRHCGGILEMKKIAALAEIHYVALAPHSAADPVGVAASLQAMAGTPNFLIQEYGGGGGDTLFTRPLVFKDGFVELPQGPGLGIEISEEGLAANTTASWRLRNMRRDPDDRSYSDICTGAARIMPENSTLPAKNTLPATSPLPAVSPAGKSARRSGLVVPVIAAVLCAFLALGCTSEPDPSASTADPEGRRGDVQAASDSPTAAATDSAWTPPRPRSVHERQRERARMVEVILDKSPMVTDGAVIRAMMDAPRHVFVHEQTRRIAYDDTPLPIGLGQTISQPYIVAYMTELLEIGPASKILEIGTGSGYQAAVLAHITPHVYTMEIIEPLLDRARGLLAEEGYESVQTRHGDGYYGWPEAGPYDAIIVTCAAGHLPPLLWSQLKPGGRIVIPIGEMTGVQRLVVVRKTADGERTSRTVMPVRFVPMTGRVEQ